MSWPSGPSRVGSMREGNPASPTTPSPRVSVVMTTFNAERYLAAAVDSILAQTMKDFEFIIVDDGSTDQTRPMLDSYSQLDPRVRPIFVERSGRIGSLNQAVQAARAPLIANLDADDVSLPIRLEKLVEAMDADPKLGLVGAAYVERIDENGKPIMKRLARPTDDKMLRRLLMRTVPFFHSSSMYRKQAWADAGGFDEKLVCLEDYDMWIKIASKWKVGNVPYTLSLKRRHPGQVFDRHHNRAIGYRTRARLLLRYFRTVRKDPRALGWAAIFSVMNRPLLELYSKVTGDGQAERAIEHELHQDKPKYDLPHRR